MTDPWLATAIEKMCAEGERQQETPLLRLALAPAIWLYLKDESLHASGSLKHRLARSLFLHALCNGWLKKDMPVVEASSGSTAISEAWFARLLGLPFFAVVPEGTASSKIAQIRRLGGECHFVKEAGQLAVEAARLAKRLNGHFMDQFTFAERATDWRSGNIADAIFRQMAQTPFPIPDAFVVGAGTGGTATTIGRYLRYRGHASRLLVVDPQHSVFYDYWRQRDRSLRSERGGLIEGIGRPCVEPSFIADVVDEMLQVPDAASIAAMHWLSQRLGKKVGASTGASIWGALQIAEEMKKQRRGGAIVTLLCDSGERYQETYYQPEWVARHIGDLRPWQQMLPSACGRVETAEARPEARSPLTPLCHAAAAMEIAPAVAPSPASLSDSSTFLPPQAVPYCATD